MKKLTAAQKQEEAVMEAEVASEGRAYGRPQNHLVAKAEIKAQLHCALGDIDKAIEATCGSIKAGNSYDLTPEGKEVLNKLLIIRRLLKAI